MNTDIRLAVGFWSHPKTFRLEKMAGLKGVRSLQILWCWCAQYRPDGNLADFNADEIEFAADWRGKKGKFIEACLASGWIDMAEDGSCRLHEWAEYNPWQAQAASRDEARREKARKAASARWGKASESDPQPCPGDAQAYAQENSSICSNDAKHGPSICLEDATSNAQAYAQKCHPLPVPVPMPEEKNLNTYCPEPSGDASRPQAPAGKIQDPVPREEAFITLPLNTGPEHVVTRSMLTEWRELYPAVDVEQQLRNMRGWLLENKQRRKTKSGVGRFIVAWLSKAQDKGGTAPPGGKAPMSWAEKADAEFDQALEVARRREAARAKGELAV